MSIFSKLLGFIGTIQLLHAGFSSYEFHQLLKTIELEQHDTIIKLPNDIKLEVLISFILIVISTFLSLNKITFYTLNDEKISTNNYLQNIKYSKFTNIENLKGSSDSGLFYNTPFLLDIVAKRNEINDYLNKEDKTKN